MEHILIAIGGVLIVLLILKLSSNKKSEKDNNYKNTQYTKPSEEIYKYGNSTGVANNDK